MFSPDTYQQRRAALAASVEQGYILLMGNEESPKNYHDNVYSFRQDSTFLYFCGIDKPGYYLGIDLASGKSCLYGDEISIDHIVWMGDQPSLREMADRAGIDEIGSPAELASKLKQEKNNLHYLPPYRALNSNKLKSWLSINQPKPSRELIEAVIAIRSIKTEEELVEIEKAVVLTRDMHHYVRDNARAGMLEAELSGPISGMAQSKGGDLAYGVILTINGQILHNHYHGNTIKDGQLILGDFGCETPMHYASDITRTWPVSGQLNKRQAEIYQLVWDSHTAAVKALQPGRSYKEVHLISARAIADGLKDLGLMKGDMGEAVAAGAHALFFPHGLGHMMGLDVHDMEDLGEDLVGYDANIQRSTQFGLRSLRLGRELQAGFVLTVEPGIYFIPQLIEQWKAKGEHNAFINYAALEKYYDFGGVRLEDDYVITKGGSRLLGPEIDK